MRKLRDKRGFTLIEISLSMIFLAILSITIVLIINNAISTYRRGLVLNQINTVGMDLVDDIRNVIQNSPTDVSKQCGGECEEGDFFVENIASTITVGGKTLNNVPVFGGFCTGRYSYIWNSGYYVKNGDGLPKKAELEGYGDNFRLIKVEDKTRSICKNYSKSGGHGNKFNLDGVVDEDAIEVLLTNDEGNSLALYDLSSGMPAINESSSGNNTAFYSVSFILGTVQGGINVMSRGNFCTAPEEENSYFDYCAINKFNFAAQANGGSNG